VLPTFLVVGAARSGTTSLHYYLAQHPDVCMSAIKEPNFFVFRQTAEGPQPCIGDDKRLLAKSVADRASYERLFDAPGALAVGEASPLYLYTRETPSLVHDVVPDMRIVAVVREPVERAWSHFLYVNGEHENAATAFADNMRRERPLGYEPYRTGTHFLRLSRYAEQLERYVEVFGRDRVLVLSYDALTGDPATALHQVCAFVGVDPAFAFDTSLRYNPSSGERSLLGRVDRVLRPAFPHLKKALPAGVAGRLAARRARLRAAGRTSEGPGVPVDVRAQLRDYFAPDVEWLRREAGIEFPSSSQT